ncbi:MAG: oligosaccharide flippase family protein [Bacteroidales bacterium]|jgi:O-antigen/teichoic acid export membrane protein|nr:oligosaccharide flippase family protein [Bacteroidales bacterium]HOI32567.1 oligosaccharide flippase family protein [Bacteroidales bacterium]
MATNPLKSLAGQTVVYGMGTIIPRLLNYMLVPFYTRVLSEEHYGQMTELYAYVAFFLVLLTYGMETAFFRFAQKTDTNKVFNAALSAILTTSAVFVVLLFFIYEPVADLIQYTGNPEYIVFVGLIVTLDAVTAIPFALLRKQNKARRFATIRILNVSLNIGLNVIFIVLIPEWAMKFATDVFGHNSSLLLWVFVANLIASLLSLVLLWPQLKRFSFCWDTSLIKPMLSYALPVLVVGLAGMVNEVIDKILLKYLLPDRETAMAQLGIYGANYKLGVLMTLFIQMFRFAAEPFFFAEAEKKDSPELFARVTNYFIISGLLIFLGVTLFMDVFQHFIGPEFRSGLNIVPVVLIANLFYGVFFNLSVWYKLTDRTKNGAVIALIGASVTLFANILLIPVMGYTGAAWAHLACYSIMMLISYLWGRKIYPVPYQVKRFVLYLSLALLLYFISEFLRPEKLLIRLSFNGLLFVVFVLLAVVFEYKGFRDSARIS